MAAQPVQQQPQAPQTQQDGVRNLADRMLFGDSGDPMGPDAGESDPIGPEAGEQGQQTEAVEDATEGAADEATEGEAEEKPEGDAPAEELEVVEFEGKTYEVPKEIKRGLLRDADYRQKTMAVAAEKQAIERHAQYIQQQATLAEQFAPLYGHITALTQQFQALQQSDWNAIRDDPIELNRRQVAMLDLRQQIGDANNYLTAKKQEFDMLQQQSIQQRRAETAERVSKEIKGWTPERDKALHAFALKSGLNDIDLATIASDVRYVKLLDKAMRHDEMLAKGQQIGAKAKELPPVAKGSGRANQSERNVQIEKLTNVVKQSGGRDSDARRALLRAKLFGGK